MQKQIIRMVFIFTLLWMFITLFYTFTKNQQLTKTENSDTRVILNEIRQLTTDENGQNPAQAQIYELAESMQLQTDNTHKPDIFLLIFPYFIITAVYLILVFTYIYWKIIRPFIKLEKYANQVAKGNLDITLDYEKTNFFGAFTWAFDHMKEEIKYARANEERAVNENKTIIATLSHDIKTPISSIRAYAEGLEANLDSSYEQRARYVQVIMRKCDEVTRLTNDLMLHSMSELERLEIKQHNISIAKLIEDTVQDLEYPYIKLKHPIPEADLVADEKRIAQVIENILNNAKKYAPATEVLITAEITDGEYQIHIRDHGKGILPEDMPFVKNRFYRGKNIGNQSGSGLGLYIVEYIMQRMNGGVRLENHTDGLEVIVWLPVICTKEK